MSLSVFDLAVNRVLDAEGGYVNDPTDRGGETNLGITARTLRDARDMRVIGREATIAELRREDAVEIYRALYWRRCGCDRLPAGLAFALFDFAVHSGTGTATKALQRALRVDPDGLIGPDTVAAARVSGDRAVAQLTAARLELVLDLIAREPEQARFRRGWLARIAETAVYAGRLAAARSVEGV